MEIFVKFIALLNLSQDFVVSVDINLSGPMFVKIGDNIWANCSSDTKTVGRTAEFIVNGETFDTLQRQDGGCFSANLEKMCFYNECHCSENGKMYGIQLNDNRRTHQIEVLCSMKFKLLLDKPFFQTSKLSIDVLDIIGPRIFLEDEYPLTSGKTTVLKCSVISKLNIHLYWDCLNYTPKQQSEGNSTLTAELRLQIKAIHNGERCTCIARYNNYTTSAFITLNITSPPIVTLDNETECNRSSSIELSCTLGGELIEYGFGPWSHKINGILIRHIHGSVSGNKLTALIDQCTHKDGGDYTCAAWNIDKNRMYWSNKTTTLRVNDAPVITDVLSLTEQYQVFSIYYYAVSFPVEVQWFKYTEKIENSTLFSLINAKTKIALHVYGTILERSGYNAYLTIKDSSFGEYKVVLKNKFGEIEYIFDWKKELPTFDFRTIVWVLTGVSIFTVIVSVVAIIMKLTNVQVEVTLKSMHRKPERPVIYYAAPADENNRNVYNTTDTSYEEPDEDPYSHYEEIADNYEELGRNVDNEQQYEISHTYFDIE